MKLIMNTFNAYFKGEKRFLSCKLDILSNKNGIKNSNNGYRSLNRDCEFSYDVKFLVYLL